MRENGMGALTAAIGECPDVTPANGRAAVYDAFIASRADAGATSTSRPIRPIPLRPEEPRATLQGYQARESEHPD
jgi:hypothetical protein